MLFDHDTIFLPFPCQLDSICMPASSIVEVKSCCSMLFSFCNLYQRLGNHLEWYWYYFLYYDFRKRFDLSFATFFHFHNKPKILMVVGELLSLKINYQNVYLQNYQKLNFFLFHILLKSLQYICKIQYGVHWIL